MTREMTMNRAPRRGPATSPRASKAWAARVTIVGIGLAVAIGLGSAVWADQTPTDAQRKQSIAIQLDEANARQRANAPKPAGGDAAAVKAADQAAHARQGSDSAP